MLISKSMKNQKGKPRLHNMTKITSSNQMWINKWLDHHQTKKNVGRNHDFLDVETMFNEWIVYWNKMDSICILDKHMYFIYKNFNKTRRTYIYEGKKKQKHDPKCILQLWKTRAIMNEKFCVCICNCYFSHW
jgi:hypothetical protein